MSQTGTYILIFHLDQNQALSIPKLGVADFPAGFYAYVGSAFGSQGLPELLKTHLAPAERQYRHIDYFQKVAQVEEVWFTTAPENREVAWADLLLAIPGATVLVEEFGPPPPELESRLFYFDLRPTLADFEVGVRQQFPDDVVLRIFKPSEY